MIERPPVRVPAGAAGEIFFFSRQGQLFVLTLVSVSVPPPLWQQHAKDPVTEKCKSDQLINQNQRSLYLGVLEFGYIHSLAMDDSYQMHWHLDLDRKAVKSCTHWR